MSRARYWVVVGFTSISHARLRRDPKKEARPRRRASFPRGQHADRGHHAHRCMRHALQDLCGPLLLFYATHHRLPNNLKELADE